MIIKILTENGNQKVDIFHERTYKEEMESFNRLGGHYRLEHNKILGKGPDSSSYFSKTTDGITWRRMIRGQMIDVLVILFPDGVLDKMDWVYEDRIVPNSQGGETSLKGWHLKHLDR